MAKEGSYDNYTLLASAARTATATSAEVYTDSAPRAAVFALTVTAGTGTSPTLDVTIQGHDPLGNAWATLATFTQVTATTTNATWNQIKTIGGGSTEHVPLRRMRAVTTVGGTSTPGHTYSLGVTLVY